MFGTMQTMRFVLTSFSGVFFFIDLPSAIAGPSRPGPAGSVDGKCWSKGQRIQMAHFYLLYDTDDPIVFRRGNPLHIQR
jgi:hypothetical protein